MFPLHFPSLIGIILGGHYHPPVRDCYFQEDLLNIPQALRAADSSGVAGPGSGSSWLGVLEAFFWRGGGGGWGVFGRKP